MLHKFLKQSCCYLLDVLYQLHVHIYKKYVLSLHMHRAQVVHMSIYVPLALVHVGELSQAY